MMAGEQLYVPEEFLLEVCTIVRSGIEHVKNITPEVKTRLLERCEEEEKYINA
jgi:hypothetical protein